MNKQFMYTLLLPAIFHISYAQNNMGPRLTAMGKAGVALADIWNLEGNPSGITGANSSIIAINYSKFLFDSELSKQAVAFEIPFKNNYLGISFQRYGITDYNEIKIGFALAKKFGNNLSLALKANYHQLKISNYGATTGFSIDVGTIYSFNENLSAGLSINNPSLQKFATKAIQTHIPTLVQAGIAYKASPKIVIATSIIKDLDQPFDAGFGLEYRLQELLSLRGGVTAKPFQQYVGFGLNYKKLVMDVAVENKPNLGYVPQIAFAYAF